MAITGDELLRRQVELLVNVGGIQAIAELQVGLADVNRALNDLAQAQAAGLVPADQYQRQSAVLTRQQASLQQQVALANMAIQNQGVVTQQMVDRVTNSMLTAGQRTAAFTRTIYFAAQGLEDLQYSFAAVVNNIPLVASSLAQAMGQSQTAAMGWAAGLSLAAVAINTVFIPAVKGIIDQSPYLKGFFSEINVQLNPFHVIQYTDSVDTLKAKIKELTDQKVKLAVDYRDLDIATAKLKKLEEGKAAYDKSQQENLPIEDARGKAVADAIKDVGEKGVSDSVHAAILNKGLSGPAITAARAKVERFQKELDNVPAWDFAGRWGVEGKLGNAQQALATADKAIRAKAASEAGNVIKEGKEGTPGGLQNLQAWLKAAGRGDVADRVGAEAYGARTPKEVKQGDEEMDRELKRRQKHLDDVAFADNKALVDAGKASDKAKAATVQRAAEASREMAAEIDRMAEEAARPKGLMQAKRGRILNLLEQGRGERDIMDEVGPGVAETMRRLPGADPSLANAASALAVRNMIAKLRPEIAAEMPGVGNDPRLAAGKVRIADDADAVAAQERADRRAGAQENRDFKAGREQSIGVTAGNLQQALGANPIEAEAISRRAHDLRDKGVSDPRALRQATTEVQQRTMGAMAKTQENQMMLANLFGDITIQIDALNQRNRLIDANLQRAQRANMNTRRNAGQGRTSR